MHRTVALLCVFCCFSCAQPVPRAHTAASVAATAPLPARSLPASDKAQAGVAVGIHGAVASAEGNASQVGLASSTRRQRGRRGDRGGVRARGDPPVRGQHRRRRLHGGAHGRRHRQRDRLPRDRAAAATRDMYLDARARSRATAWSARAPRASPAPWPGSRWRTNASARCHGPSWWRPRSRWRATARRSTRRTPRTSRTRSRRCARPASSQRAHLPRRRRTLAQATWRQPELARRSRRSRTRAPARFTRASSPSAWRRACRARGLWTPKTSPGTAR